MSGVLIDENGWWWEDVAVPLTLTPTERLTWNPIPAREWRSAVQDEPCWGETRGGGGGRGGGSDDGGSGSVGLCIF